MLSLCRLTQFSLGWVPAPSLKHLLSSTITPGTHPKENCVKRHRDSIFSYKMVYTSAFHILRAHLYQFPFVCPPPYYFPTLFYSHQLLSPTAICPTNPKRG